MIGSKSDISRTSEDSTIPIKSRTIPAITKIKRKTILDMRSYAAVLVAVSMLAGIVATTPITAVYADNSETEKNQKCKGDINASGKSEAANVVNCILDNFESFG